MVLTGVSGTSQYTLYVQEVSLGVYWFLWYIPVSILIASF